MRMRGRSSPRGEPRRASWRRRAGRCREPGGGTRDSVQPPGGLSELDSPAARTQSQPGFSRAPASPRGPSLPAGRLSMRPGTLGSDHPRPLANGHHFKGGDPAPSHGRGRRLRAAGGRGRQRGWLCAGLGTNRSVCPWSATRARSPAQRAEGGAHALPELPSRRAARWARGWECRRVRGGEGRAGESQGERSAGPVPTWSGHSSCRPRALAAATRS